MILEIRIRNMYSIKDEVVLDMTAGGSKSQNALKLASNCFDYKGTEVLKSIAIYGANASGKSNIAKAISFCCMMILHSHNHNQDAVFNFKPFKFDGCDKTPSAFFIRFVISGIEYEYSFSMTNKEIITENLYYYPKGRRAEVFTRDESVSEEKNEVYHFTSVIKRPMDVAINTSRKSLFISRASLMDRDIAKGIYSYFANSVIFNKGISVVEVETLFTEHKTTLLAALQMADSDIVDIMMHKERVKGKNLNADFVNNIASIDEVEQDMLKFTTYHKNNISTPFDFETEESEGTKNLFYNMLYIIDIVRNGRVLLWDEIEQSLHSRIVDYIFTLFHNSKSAQLICTTHNTNLLNLNKLRKDQIYFVNKQNNGSSDLYSLFDYKDFRENMDVEKAYLQGRFDAVPYINDSELNLKMIVENEKA